MLDEGDSRKIKILFAIESLGCGGAEKSLVSLLSLLDRQKYDLYLWMIHPEGAFKYLLSEDITVVEQPRYHAFESFLVRLSAIAYSLMRRWNHLIGKDEYWGESYYKSRGRAIKVPRGRWDIVVAYHQGLVTYVVADKFRDCKKVGWVNADIFKTGYNIRFNARFYRKIDRICVVSDILHGLMENRLPEFSDKYLTVWDIVSPQVIRELARHPVSQLKGSSDEYVFVTTGRLHAIKGYDLAVEAGHYLKRKGLKFKWYFIGEGPERKSIERLIHTLDLQDEIILLGLQTNPYPYMAQADVYVQTSRHEGFCMTIAEAKILALPIVSTNFDVVYNQIEHQKNGLIAEMDGQKIGAQIMRLVHDDALRERIRNAVRKEDNTTCLTETKKVEKLFDDLTA